MDEAPDLSLAKYYGIPIVPNVNVVEEPSGALNSLEGEQ
jgi:hypothetical protein